MLKFVVGVPGSGKTYYAVDYLFNNNSKFEYIYTNLNLNKDKVRFDFFDFKYDLLIKHLTKIKEIFDKSLSNKDELIIEYLKQNKLYKSIFIIDECHNFFDKSNDLLTFFLTYHRHLFLDIILITQNLDLVFYKYLKISESFIVAQRSTFKITQRYNKYSEYGDFKLYTKINTFSLLKNKDVFAIYSAGDFVNTKSPFKKFFYLIIVVFLIIAFLIKTLISSLFSDDISTQTNTTQTVQTVSQAVTTTITNESDLEKIYISLTCFNFNNNEYSDCFVSNNKYIVFDYFSTIKFFSSKNIKKQNTKYSNVSTLLTTFKYSAYLTRSDLMSNFASFLYDYDQKQELKNISNDNKNNSNNNINSISNSVKSALSFN